jgi:hypothetical protein
MTEDSSTMFLFDSSQLEVTLERSVQARTGRQVRHLAIEVGPERIVLRGQATTYYAKQLAQQAVRELLPHVPLVNVIAVVNRREEAPAPASA